MYVTKYTYCLPTKWLSKEYFHIFKQKLIRKRNINKVFMFVQPITYIP